MKYYSIFPGNNGLEAHFLGEFEDFELANVADVFQEREDQREPSIWIANDNDMKMLYSTIRRTMRYDA